MTAEKREGAFFIFEGIDGTGKSTHIQLLAQYLTTRGYNVVTTREPTDSVHGQAIRLLYSNRGSVTHEEELELFLLDREEHVETLIKPALAEGAIVLCDRYYLSTIAYQGALGVSMEEIRGKNAFAPEPDLAFLMQVPPERSLMRIRKREANGPNDFEKEEYLKKVDAIFSQLDYPYIRRIDANLPKEAVQQKIRRTAEAFLAGTTPI